MLVDRDAYITEVSKRIGKDWKRLARQFMLDTDIDAIEYDNPSDLKEQIFQFFRKWKQQLGENATVERLSEGLKAAGLQELDSLVKQMLRNTSDPDHAIHNTDPPSGTDSTIKNADLPSVTDSTIRNTDPHSSTGSTIQRTGPCSDPDSTTQNTDPSSGTGSTILQDPQKDTLNELAGELFDNPLYNISEVWCKYRPSFRTVIICIILMYQFGVIALVTLCEDEGLLHHPISEHSVSSDLMVRTLKLALRILLQVVTPLVFMLHLDTLAKKPVVPKFMSLTREEALERIYTKLGTTEEVVKSRITLRWQSTVLNNILFAAFIYYLGVFITTNYCEGPPTAGNSICNYLHTVLFNSVIEGTQTVVFVIVIGIMKEFYCYENKIAVYAMVIGEEGQKLYDEIRKRWSLVDQYCYWVPVGLLLIAVISYITGKGLIPKPRQDIEQSEIITWYFWNFVLSGLTLLGSSPSRLIKHAASISYILLTIFVYALEHNGIKIPGTGTNSAMIFLYAALAVFNFNLIFSLYKCNKHHHAITPDMLNSFRKYLCLMSMFVLPVLITFMTSREVIFFVPFIKKQF